MSHSGGAAVAIRGVTKTFGAFTAVNNLSLTVPRGAVYGFIGPNGSGKTTTLRMIMHILHPDSGEIEVLGERTTRAAHDRVGYLPEERGLYKSMTVRDVLQFYAGLKGMRLSRPAVDDWLARMGLSEWAGKKVQALSKGMSQKVQFIAAVIAKPELVLLDEPFSGLDPVNLEVLREAVLDLRRDGTTVIFSTHDMNVAERMCDSIFMIYRGNKVLDGTLDSIQATYGTDTLRVRLDGHESGVNGSGNGDGRVPANLPGVQKLTDFGRYQELRLASGVDSQSVLAALMNHGRVVHFELARPSLQDIFVRIAAPEMTGADHA
jgi:ABC-2 type transport system ATP-binding protein